MTWELTRQDRAGLIAVGLQQGTVAVPTLLIKHYRALQLTEAEAMLLIHLIAFREKEQVDFPTFEELAARMSLTQEELEKCLQRLMKRGVLRIDESVDPGTGIQSERYNWDTLYGMLAEQHVLLLDTAAQDTLSAADWGESDWAEPSDSDRNLFRIFEKEFGRPLSPMECETISGWIDQDRYPEELIVFALKESVFAGKLHFRYIDRILLEWNRNRIRSLEEAKAFSRKFRGER